MGRPFKFFLTAWMVIGLGPSACSMPADEEVSVLPLLMILADPGTQSAGVTLSQTSVTATEGGATGSYSIALNTSPTATVRIAVSTDAQTTASPTTVAFSGSDYFTAQTVTVTAVNDSSGEGTHTGAIAHTLSSSDSGYNGLAASGVTAIITDNDVLCKRIFRTTTTTTGAIGSITAADAICAADASKPTTGTYKALLVDGVSRIASTTANSGVGQVDWVLAASTVYYRTDCTTVIFATNSVKLFVFGTATNSIDATANTYYTGLATDWTTSANDCTNWTVTGTNGMFGIGNSTSNTMIAPGAAAACTTARSLLCVEQ